MSEPGGVNAAGRLYALDHSEVDTLGFHDPRAHPWLSCSQNLSLIDKNTQRPLCFFSTRSTENFVPISSFDLPFNSAYL